MNNIVGLSKIGLESRMKIAFLLAIIFVLLPMVWVDIEAEKLPAPMLLMK